MDFEIGFEKRTLWDETGVMRVWVSYNGKDVIFVNYQDTFWFQVKVYGFKLWLNTST